MKNNSADLLMDEHTQEIIEYIPNAFQRWVVFFIFAILLALLSGSYFVWYPETLKGRIVIPVSEGGTPIYATLYAGPSNIGKVKEGARVMVFTEEYPEGEYGFLNGEVARINGIPNANGFFKIEVSFPNGLKTNYGYELSPRIQLSGTGEIVLRERRLLETIVKPFNEQLR